MALAAVAAADRVRPLYDESPDAADARRDPVCAVTPVLLAALHALARGRNR